MNNVSIYKASAGSGKTFTLAVQYIRLLITIHPLEYRHTLAVTFTNKATAEMKARILEQLYGLSRGLKSSDGYMQALQQELKDTGVEMSEKQIREACGEALCFILHDYSRFRIETIDSFFQSVLRNLAHELGLNARLQVDLNERQIIDMAVDNLIDSLGRRQEGSVQVGRWIDAYVQQQLENAEAWDVRRSIKSLSSVIFQEHYMRRDESFHKLINDEDALTEFRSSIYATLEAAKKVMHEVSGRLQKAISSFPYSVVDVVNRGEWVIKYAEQLVDGNYAQEMTDKRYEGLLCPKSLLLAKFKDNEKVLNAWCPVCDTMLEAEELRRSYRVIENSVLLTARHIAPMRLLNQVEEEVTQITNDSNRFILSKTPILLSRLIEGSDAPFVFEKMGTLFHHVMIDEFQDTSRLQWENFKVLLLESCSSGGSSLIVGDVKQSIYRFRGGDWRILKDIHKELSLPPQATHTLDTNYRSDERIIRFNNSFFAMAARLLDPENEKGMVQEIYADVRQKWTSSAQGQGYVNVTLCDTKKEDWQEWMLEDMCQQIEALHAQGVAYESMAILARTHAHTPEILRYVQRRLGIQLLSDKGFKLGSSTALLMIVAALRMLIQRDVDPVPERYLVKTYLNAVEQREMALENYINVKAEDVLPKEFMDEMPQLRSYPLYELCEYLYRVLHLDRIEGNDAYVLAFFDELGSFLQQGNTDIQSFLEYWDSDMAGKDIPQCQVDAISILTIHKAKGLQYHTVFVPFCDNALEKHMNDDILWCEASREPFNLLGALPLSGSSKQFEESDYKEGFREELFQRRVEEFNALYVAFTRAEHNLYVWGDASKNTANYAKLLGATLGEMLESSVCLQDEIRADLYLNPQQIRCESAADSDGTRYVFGTPVGAIAKKTDKIEENRMEPQFDSLDSNFCSYNRCMEFRQSNDASKYIAQQGESEEGQAPSQSFIEQGKLLHEVFSHLERYEQLDKVLQDYRDQGIIADAKQLSQVHRLVERGMNDARVRSWFSGDCFVVNECEIVHRDPQTGEMSTHRPDRVMIREDEVVVVDFKFGKPRPEEYESQVRGYMRLISEMYPRHKVSGYLWYVYSNRVEEVR